MTSAQAPPTASPATEIFLASFKDAPGKTIRLGLIGMSRHGFDVGKPVNITNNPGYDNQPSFLPDSSALLLSSNRDGRQTDIYRYDIAKKALAQITHTADNEYSPTVTPGRRTFTTVRGVEQSIWRFNLDGSDAGLVAAPSGLIGSHVWISPGELAMLILGAQGAPDTLQLMDLATGASEVVASNIGRSLHIRPGTGTLTFVDKSSAADWVIKELDPAARKIATLAPTVDGSEDLAWTPSGRLVMGADSKLFVWEGETDRWVEIANLTKAGVTGITGIAFSPDGKWIAIVSGP